MQIEELLDKLKAKKFIPHYAQNEQEANQIILDLVQKGQSIGIGGSMTVKQLGVDLLLQNKGVEVLSHSLVPADKKDNLYEYARHADWYMASANAITKDGDLVNIDGTANRVSTLIFGVPNIIYVIGVNKIVEDFNAAIERIRNYTCHLNAVRLDRETPCKYTGKCANCASDDCMCNTTVIVHHPTKLQKQVHIILINKELGY